MEIKSAADLEPKSQGFANRAAESINIIGGVVETLFNSIGGAISDIAGQPHGSHLNIIPDVVDRTRMEQMEPDPTDRINRRPFDTTEFRPAPPVPKVIAGHPELTHVPQTADSLRIQRFIEQSI